MTPSENGWRSLKSVATPFEAPKARNVFQHLERPPLNNRHQLGISCWWQHKPCGRSSSSRPSSDPRSESVRGLTQPSQPPASSRKLLLVLRKLTTTTKAKRALSVENRFWGSTLIMKQVGGCCNYQNKKTNLNGLVLVTSSTLLSAKKL